jgi:subtilisin family serine protease
MSARRRRASTTSVPARSPVEPLELRLLFSTTIHNDSFDVTDLTALRADAAYSSITGAGVGIAVLDTGVDIQNPDLTGQVVAYYNAVEDPIPTAAPGTTGAVDNDGHGTNVSGIAASANPDIGVAYGAHLVDVKVIADSGETQLSGDPLLRGLEFVAEYASTYNIKVVNMSLGEATDSGGINDNTVPAADDISTEIGVLESMGITVVAAAGNSYANDPAPGESYPAVVSTISVASAWSDTGSGYDFDSYAYGTPEDSWAAVETSAEPDQFSATSQRSTLGNQVVAPGVNVTSDWNGSSTGDSGGDLQYNTISGTSMATPFVSGLVALMQQAAYTYGGRYITDPQEVLSIIRETSDVIGDPNVAGDGRVPISDGELTGGAEESLDGTGDSYDRVNVLHAIEAVQELFTGTVSNADTDDTTATATAVPAIDGDAVETEAGNIGTDGLNDVGADDVDLYAVTLTSTGTLTVALSLPSGGTAFTAELRVFDGNGNTLAAVAGTSTAGYPTLTVGTTAAPLAAGTYYVGVSSVGNASYTITGPGSNQTGATGGTGDYSLSLSLSNPDPNGVIQGAEAVDLTDPNYEFSDGTTGNEYDGILGSDPAPTGSSDARVAVPNGDVDMFAVVAPDTGTVTAEVDATDYGFDGADSYVEVFTEDAATGAVTVIGSNGMASDGPSNSQLTFDVTLGETYYVAVTVDANAAFSPTDPYDRLANSTATPTEYNLFLTFANGNTNGTALLATAATVGTAEAGDIGSTTAGFGADGGFKYVNWYAYTPTTSGLLDLSATANSSGFSPNVQLWTVTTDPTTGAVAGIEEVAGVTGSGQDLIAPVTAGETVYVSVTGDGNSNFNWYSLASGSGGQTGTYALASSLISDTSAQAKALNDNSIDDGTPETITTAAPASGDIGMDGGLVVGDTDVDLYVFTPATTGPYDIRTGTSQEGSADTYLRLFDRGGNQLASNDNADSTTTASYIRADLTAGVTYYIGVSGTGNETYDPITGGGTTDSATSGVYTLSVAVATLPAITIASPAPVAPTAAGATLAFVVSLDRASSTAVTVDYATADGSAVAGTDYTATSGTLTIPAGQTSATIDVPVLVDTGADATLTFTVDLSDPSDNALLDGGQATGTITDLPVTQLPFNRDERATYDDADGHRVTIALTGPGSGVVDVIGTAAERDEQVTVTTTGTTAASRLSIASTGGGTALAGLAVTGSLASLSASTTTLAGDLTVTGTIGSITLAGATGADTLSVQGRLAVGTLRLGAVSDLTVDVAEPLAELSATSWANLSGDDVVTAPAIRLLSVAGAFAAGLSVGSGTGTPLDAVRIGGAVAAGAWQVKGSVGTATVGSTAVGWSADVTGSIGSLTVNGTAAGSITAATVRAMRVRTDLSDATLALTAAGATDLGSLAVGGTIDDSTITTVGSVGTVRAAGMLGSSLLAGVSPAVTGLPSAAADYTADDDVLSFTVTGLPGGATSFAGSDVAAARIGAVSLRRVDTANGGVPFGFAADALSSFADAEPGVATYRWTDREPTSRLAFNGDLAVRVFGGQG